MQKLYKKGQTIDLITGTVLGLMILFFLIFAVLFGISALNPTTFFDTASAEANATEQFQRNITFGIGEFGSKIPVVMLILGVVLAIAGIVILVLYVKRMRDSGGGSSL